MAQCRRRSTVLKSGRSCSPGRIRAEFRDAAEAPPGQVNGTVHAADGAALQAKNDLTAAYDDVAARPTTATVPVELGGTTKTPGVYDSPAGTFGITAPVVRGGPHLG